jgi:heptosyltransferase-2
MLPRNAGLAPPRLATDCRHFLGDRPCRPHKETGATCVCPAYAPIRERVLVIKLDAMGDVLRTTAILPALAARHPDAAIEWLTRPESVPLLEKNPYVHTLIGYGPDALVRLQAVAYARVINLDSGALSAGLAAMARGARRDGYVLSDRGHVLATNPAAQEWLEMGTDDCLKRANTTRSYQEIMLGILDLAGAAHGYVLALTEAERAWAKAHAASLGLDPARPLVGLNIGAGGRWELKRWRLEGFAELCRRLDAAGVQIALLGGKAEAERSAALRAAAGVPVIDTGTDHDLRRFSALVSLCDVVVTGDTLAMHIGLALGRRSVVLFGPTSHAEIELYGLGEKVYPAMDCLGCYKTSCDFVPNCMDLISTDMVADAVMRQLALARSKSA